MDWDHTLVNPNESIGMAIDKTIKLMADEGYDIHQSLPQLSAASILADPVARAEIIGHLKEKYRDVFDADVSCKVASYYKTCFREVTDHYTKPITNASNLLLYLNKENIPWAIVSHKSQDTLEHEYNLFFSKIQKEPILLGGPDRPLKPAPDSLLEAIKTLGIPEKEAATVWMVGDSLSTDIGAAKNAGCTPLWFGDYAKNAGSNETQDTIRVGTHQETIALLKQLCEKKAAHIHRHQ